MPSNQFQSKTVNGLNVHIMPTDKFKTTSIVVYVAQELTEEFVTKTALLPFVLKRGTAQYPTMKAIREKLDNLYGTIFDADVVKRGEKHVMKFRMDIANEKYLSDPEPLLQNGIAFLGSVLTKPLMENDGFKSSYVNSEKEIVRKRIESLVDDKIGYAAERCIEEMCKEEPYRLFTYGRKQDLQAINAQSLFEYYKEVFSHNPIDIFIVGDVEPKEVFEMIEKEIVLERKEIKKLSPTTVEMNVNEVKKVVDRLDVNQGKLNLGLRTNIAISDERYPAILMFNGILGGYPHSKLFVNVREKESLAYYASSRMDGHKGIMTIQSGIQIENYDKAVTIIEKQLDAMQQGEITDDELLKTKATLSNDLREIKDRPYAIVDFAYSAIIGNYERSMDELLSRIESLTKEDIVNAGRSVKLDTIYFLTSKGGNA